MALVREPKRARLLQDSLRAVFFALFAGAAAAVVRWLPPAHPPWLDVAGRILAVLTVELVAIALLREIVPKPVVGSHLVGRDKGYLRWLMSSAFADVVMHPLLRFPFSLFHLTRFLYLRAAGARIAFGAAFAGELTVRDPCLLVVEEGAQLEPGVIVEGALHATGRVTVDRVTVGAGSLVGAHAILMPGAHLGHDVRISPAAYVGRDVSIGVGVKIGERAVLAAGVEIGSHAKVGPGAVLGEGVKVGDHARVMAGAVIPANTTIRESEVWQGVPARPLYRDRRGRPREANAV